MSANPDPPPPVSPPQAPGSVEPPSEPPPEPTLGELVASNLKLIGAVCGLAFVAYWLWRGLAALFPELTWLQGPSG